MIYHEVERSNNSSYLWSSKRTAHVTVVCFNPDGLCLCILAAIPYRVQVLHALNSSSSLARTRRVTEASSQETWKHYTITLTWTQTWWLISWINHAIKGRATQTQHLFFGRRLLPNSSFFSSASPLFFSQASHFLFLAVAGRPAVLALFITQLWHFWIKLHTHTDWTLLVRARKHFGFQ